MLPNLKKTTKKLFTLLEVMVAIALLVIASGVIGVKMHQAVEKKHFQSSLERLRARLVVTQKIAVATQADWQGTLTKKDAEWIFKTDCEESKLKKLAPLRLSFTEVYFNGKKIDELTIDFFASGQVLPVGDFVFVNKTMDAKWMTTDLFQRKEGKKLGPMHPSGE